MNLSQFDFAQLYREQMQQMTRRERDPEYLGPPGVCDE